MEDEKPLISQASAVPYRRDEQGRLEFCLITSTGRGDWIFPKGIVDPGETLEETALKEAEEEAGIIGRLEDKPLGTYDYRKWGTTLQVTAFLMRVTDESETWHEADLRRRAWHSPEEAWTLLERANLRTLLEQAVARLAPPVEKD